MNSTKTHDFDYMVIGCPVGAKAASMSVLLVMQTDKNHLKLGYKKRWWRLGGNSKFDHYGIVRTYHVKNTRQRGCGVERIFFNGSRLHFPGPQNLAIAI